MNPPNEGIELLYTNDCQAWPEALANLKTAITELGIKEEPQLVALDTIEQAEEYNFFASPTIHIHGTDIDPHARRTHKIGLGTGRPYFANGMAMAAPTIDMIKTAIQELYYKEHN